MPKKLTAFVEAGKVFLLSRVVILFISYVSVNRFPFSPSNTMRNCAVHINDCLIAGYHWDAQAYVHIAQYGYSDISYTAFFPLWPLLEHLAGSLFATDFTAYYYAGLVLANIFFYAALVLLYMLISEDFEETVARKTLFFLAFNPYGLFFFLGFTESLFLFLCVGVFYCLNRQEPGYWWLAGFLGMLAVATRSAGICVAIPFLILAVRRFWQLHKNPEETWSQKIHMFLPIAIIPCGLLLYMLYLKHHTGNPFIFSVEEAKNWHRYLSLPWTGIVATIHMLATTSHDQVTNVVDLLFTIIPIGVLIAGWRRLPLHYSLFAAMLMLLSLLYPLLPPMPLASAPRYMLVIFPVTVILAIWSKRESIDRIYTAISLTVLAINIALFVGHYWVA